MTWLPYLDCIQRVADDDAGCTWGSRRLAGYSAPGLRTCTSCSKTEQRTQALTFTCSVHAQSSEGTLRHGLTHRARQREWSKTWALPPGQVRYRKGGKGAGITGYQCKRIKLDLSLIPYRGFPDSSVGKESACNARDPGLIPGSGRSAGEGIGYLLQYSWASPCGSAGKESTCNVGDLGLISRLGRSPGEGEWLPTPVFWPREFHGLYPWGHKESDMAELLL